MTVTGVRSSWLASEVNCVSALKERSSRSNISSKAPASRLISLFPRGRPMRFDRSSPPEMLSAAAMTFSMGLKDRLDISQPPSADTTTRPGSSAHASGTITSMTPSLAALSMVPRTHTVAPPTFNALSYT